jgi:hypothetical protein
MKLAMGFQLPPRLSLNTQDRFESRGLWKRAKTLRYNVTQNVTLSAGHHSESGFGGGLVFRL